MILIPLALFACSSSRTAQNMHLSYEDLVARLTDLERLAVPEGQ